MNVSGLFASLLDLYAFIVLVYVVMSWLVMTNPSGVVMDLYRTLATICEPYLGLFRRFVPQIQLGGGGLDLAPLVGLLVLEIAANIVRGL